MRRSGVAKNDGTICADPLRGGGSDGVLDVDGFDFLRLNGDGGQSGFSAVTGAKRWSDRQSAGHLIIAKFEFRAPAGVGGSVGDELLLVGCCGRWVLRRSFTCWGGVRIARKAERRAL